MHYLNEAPVGQWKGQILTLYKIIIPETTSMKLDMLEYTQKTNSQSKFGFKNLSTERWVSKSVERNSCR